MTRKRYLLFITIICLTIVGATSCKDDKPVSREGFYLDTLCSITIRHMDEKDAQTVIDQAFAVCGKYESILSKTVEGSDVYKLNHAGGKPVKVRSDTLTVLKKGLEYGALSKGKFDITIGAVSELWNFKGNSPKIPDQKKLDRALKTVDYRQVNITGDQVRLEKSGAKLDLGGIAKGYIADRLGSFLEEQGVRSAIVNLGGNVVTIGEKNEGIPWSIGIERPYSDRTEILGSVEMRSGSVVTSGVYERKFMYKGKLYHHILDPVTGYPVKTQLDAVTLRGNKGDSMICDGLSTICLILGKSENADLRKHLQQQGIEAIYIDKNDKVTMTDGIKIKKTN